MRLDEREQDALSSLEGRELPLLSLGVVDVAMSAGEAITSITQVTGGSRDDAAALLETLLVKRAVVPCEELPGPGGPYFRTRMAEAVRLFARLKQLFPGQPWEQGPDLVADYRLLTSPRARVPRSKSARDAFVEVAAAVDGQVADLEAMKLILEGRTWSDFQLRASAAILEDQGRQTEGAVSITAGTGAGKTLAYLLPALTRALRLRSEGDSSAKVIALYPRTELLKDQLAQLAREIRRLGASADGLRVGAWFGAVKGSLKDLTQRHSEPLFGGLNCFEEGCLGDYRVERRGSVICDGVGRHPVPGWLVISRDELKESPPDFLLTTSETLNRNLSGRAKDKAVFGVGPSASGARLLVLDEAHLYWGIHGAQVAYVLRRWRAALRESQAGAAGLTVVSLSATIARPAEALAALTGLPASRVRVVSPGDKEIEWAGREYCLALLANPSGGASVLSTAIQATMLTSRILDIDTPQLSTFGSRLFVFAESLDLASRLWSKVADAEGWSRRRGGLVASPRGPLASLRSSTAADAAARLAGQVWDLPERIGHNLADRRDLSRVTSLVDGASDKDIVIATSSLEVGVDDPRVGAVLQYRSPVSAASFVQRKGRAGRQPGMRPWTLVVLSDLGKDRLNFQTHEHLFSPVIEPMPIPLRNSYVIRTQVVFATLDWLSSQFGPEGRNIFALLTVERDVPRLRELGRLLTGVLDSNFKRQRLAEWLSAALGLSLTQLHPALYGPGGLFLEVLPKLRRRAHTAWLNEPERRGSLFGGSVLPEHLPASLFTELGAPELVVYSGPPHVAAVEDEGANQRMPLLQAITEFSPGRVSYRYADDSGRPSWTPASSGREVIDLKASFDLDLVGARDLDGEAILCFRPLAVKTSPVPEGVRDESRTSLQWRSRFDPIGDPRHLLGLARLLPGLVKSVDSYTSDRAAAVRVGRYAVGCAGRVVMDNRPRPKYDEEWRFLVGDQPAAIGLEFDADGLRIGGPEERVLDDILPGLEADLSWLGRHRLAYLETRLSGLPEIGPFMSRRVASAAICACHEGAEGNPLTQKHVNSVSSEDLVHWVSQVGSSEPGSDDADPSNSEEELGEAASATSLPGPRSKVLERLEEALRDQRVIGRIRRLLTETLCGRPSESEEWRRYLHRSLLLTLGELLLEAHAVVSPQAQATRLLIDVSGSDIWITEASPGGLGAIRDLADFLEDDPTGALLGLDAVTRPSFFEDLDTRLFALVTGPGWTSAALEAALSAARDAQSNPEARLGAIRNLSDELAAVGFQTRRELFTAVNGRLLHPSSTAERDALLRDFLQKWEEASKQLGTRLRREVAFALLRPDDARALDVITWHRDWADAGPSSAYNPFAPQALVDWNLLRNMLPEWARWDPSAAAPLGNQPVAMQSVPAFDESAKSASLCQLAEPLDLGVVLDAAYVAGVRRSTSNREAVLLWAARSR